ncbi:MAG: mannose-1-phosphate guanylyltransferase [Candidatus Pacebacteria bacterium]|nr:mannose-1-phosphate guanylyltransferase [Candidatus Paceibacterota bacterium]
MKTINEHNYVLIMAGGSGSRLYPRSTDMLPKQFQQIVGDNTLIEQAYNRARKIVDDNHIYISSNHRYIDLIKKHLPNIPIENYITEPVKRNTGPAIALATALIFKKDPDAIITAVHSDHLVIKTDEYVKAIKTGIKVVEENSKYILCVGITPTSAHTGLGYIEKNEKFAKVDGYIVYDTKRFVEKPNLELAKQYVSSGNFFWNAGYFVWQAKHFLSELKKYGPQIYNGVIKISKTKGSNDYSDILDNEFVKFEDISIDNLIMEKTSNLLVLPVDIGWSDVGSWDVVADMVKIQDKDIDGNYTEGTVINIDTHNTIVLSHDASRVVATIGLDNYIIVTTEEAIVIVPRGRSEDVKKIVSELNIKKI